MKPFDVLIIGAGVSGSAIARELSRYRLRIALLEKESEPAFGVSKSNSGIIHPGTQNPPNSLKGHLCVAGNRLMKNLARDLGVHYEEIGELIVGFTPEDILALEKIKHAAEALGVPELQLVDRLWLSEHEPNLNFEVLGALYAPTAGIISPYRLVYALVENAQRNGVRLFTQRRVVRIEPLSAGFKLFTQTQEEFQTRAIINATGLFADEIARLVGIKNFKIVPRKGEEYLLDIKLRHLTKHLIFPLPTAASKGILVIKTSDGNPMIGPTADLLKDKDDLSTSQENLNKIVANVQRLVPSINPEDIIAYFAGLRPVAGEDFIIREEATVPGFIQVAGIQSPGLTSAPAIALMVADLLRHSGMRLRKKFFFHAHRPASIHLFALSLADAQKLIRRMPGYGDIVCRCEMVSAQEIRDAIRRGAKTLDGVKFRTRAQAGRCHGGFCTTRIMKILAEELHLRLGAISKRGPGSEIVKGTRADQLEDQHEKI